MDLHYWRLQARLLGVTEGLSLEIKAMPDPKILSGTLTQIGKSVELPNNAWKYEYIKVGGERIDNFHVASYINADFYAAHEKEVTLSVLHVKEKNHGGLAVAIRTSEGHERCAELTAGQAWTTTLIAVGVNIFGLAFIGAIAWFFALLAVMAVFAGMLALFGKDYTGSGVFNVAAIVSLGLLLWLFVHTTFISKSSMIGSRKAYNAAVRALD